MDELRTHVSERSQSSSKDRTQYSFPGSEDDLHLLLKRGDQSNVMITKIDGHGAGKYLYLRENRQLDLTDDTADKNKTLLNWSVKPKRQYGKFGFSIMLYRRFDGQESYPSLVVDEESDLVALGRGCYQDETDNFWSIVPIRKATQNWQNTKFTTFQIVDMKTNRPLVARWCLEGGTYQIECGKVRRIGHTVAEEFGLSDREANTLWGFENEIILKTYPSPGQEIFLKLYNQCIFGMYSIGSTNILGMHLSHNKKTGVVLDSYGYGSAWFMCPWKERGKSCVLITTWPWGDNQFQLAVDTDGESVILSEGVMNDVEFQDNKWVLVPVEERYKQGVYVIRKCLGNNAGAKLAVEESSGRIVCTKSKDSDYCKWILSI